MNSNPSFFAPAKLILFGEHAVLQGYACLVVPLLHRGTTLRVKPSQKAGVNQIFWNNMELCPKNAPVITKMMTYLEENVGTLENTAFYFETDVESGCGLGGSAMVASLLAQWAKQGEDFCRTLDDIAHGGNSSGVDALCVWRKEAVWAEKGVISSFAMPAWLKTMLNEELTLFFTGKPDESTAEMVKKLLNTDFSGISMVKKADIMGETPRKALLGEIMNQYGRILATNGAVPVHVAKDLEALRHKGFVCKLCGAGGFKTGGGYGVKL